MQGKTSNPINFLADIPDKTAYKEPKCTSQQIKHSIEPPPHGIEIKRVLAGIIGEDNCYFY